jgi:hypothetical protein
MNRRTFLKSLTAACGAAVACSGGLLKPDPWIKAATLRKKNNIMFHNVFVKARQQGCTNSILYSIPYYFGVSRNYMSRPSGYIVAKA